jgi:hypothetical protein
MLMDVPTVRAIGLDQGQGLYYSNTFYWGQTARAPSPSG